MKNQRIFLSKVIPEKTRTSTQWILRGGTADKAMLIKLRKNI